VNIGGIGLTTIVEGCWRTWRS